MKKLNKLNHCYFGQSWCWCSIIFLF